MTWARQPTRRIPPRVSNVNVSHLLGFRRRQLIDALVDVGPLRSDLVTLPDTEESIVISRPIDFDRLIDDAAADPEQNLPYWAELWPSGIALAANISQNPEVVRGKRVLELGCGLGVTAISALRADADLLVTDYAVEALALCSLNALDQVGRTPDTLQMNWRDPDVALLAAADNGFPVVLAADVLYEGRDVEPLLALCERLVTPGGMLWLAEPGRPPAAKLIELIRTRGWDNEKDQCTGPWPDEEDNRKGVVVTIHRLCRPLD